MEKYQLFKSEHHKVILNKDAQLYLGRAIVVLKSEKPSLSELTSDEWIDFGNVVEIYESALKKCFNATYFNWGCFLNDSFKVKPYHPKIHWQVRPRYEFPVEFEGTKFVDEAFSSQFLRKEKELRLSEAMLEKVYRKILPFFEV